MTIPILIALTVVAVAIGAIYLCYLAWKNYKYSRRLDNYVPPPQTQFEDIPRD